MTESVIKNGTKKNDVFEITLGEGKVYEINGKSGGKDTITFVSQDSLTPMDFTYTQAKDGDVLTKDLIITKGSDTIRIKDYFTTTEANSTKSSVKYFETNDGKFLISDFVTYNGEYTAKKGVINGTMFSDNITGTDGNDKIYGKGGNDQIFGGDGNDYIKAGNGVLMSLLDGGEGNDTIKLGSSAITLGKGGTGNDKIYGGTGIINIIEGGEGDDKIYAGSPGKNNNLNLEIPEELNTLLGGGSLNMLLGGEGNDKLYANSGSDMFALTSDLTTSSAPSSYGHDIIYSANKNDALVFDEQAGENLEFNKEGNNLVIKTGEDSSVTLSKFFKAKKGNALDKFIVDGAQHSILNDAIINVTGKGKINGTNYNDNITGSDKKDTIKTGVGVNIVDGNGGNDYIDSTKGNNTIIINDGDGNDTILAGANSETHLLFDPYKEFSFTKKGNDLIITHKDEVPIDLDDEPNTTPETVTLKNYFQIDKKGNLLNKNVTINDSENGNIDNRQDLLQVLQNENVEVLGKENKANKIDLRKYQDTFDFNVIGGNKNDKIYLGAGDHIISSGAGNDTITVGNGDNTINMGAGNDKVKAGNGDNTFYYTSGKDVIESGIGDDTYNVVYSSDMNLTIKDNGGEDRLYMDNLDRTELHAFCHFDKYENLIISNNDLYLFGTDEEGNSMLNYDNIVNGMKGKDMSGVIKIENYFEKTYEGTIETTLGRGRIESFNDQKFNPLYGPLSYEVASWLSSYKGGYFESTVDVLSRGSQDDINAMLNIYNEQSLNSCAALS